MSQNSQILNYTVYTRFYFPRLPIPPSIKEHLSDIFFHLAHVEGELICTVKSYIGSSYFFRDQKGKE